ncbi:MAG: hypothetical protein ACLP81_07970, partial [Acidimicrobiales bacterium]
MGMNENLYVATNAEGVETTATGEITWTLPRVGAALITPGDVVRAPAGGELVLRRPVALLEALDERIFAAEAAERAD